jgi:hypothetical protein
MTQSDPSGGMGELRRLADRGHNIAADMLIEFADE